MSWQLKATLATFLLTYLRIQKQSTNLFSYLLLYTVYTHV